MWTDIRRALVALRHAPSFAVVVVVTSALAIGANVATFALVNALFLQPLPVRDPQSLVEVATQGDGSGFEGGLSFPMYRELQKQQRVFAAVLGWFGNGVYALATDGEETRGSCLVVSGNLFSELGVRPALGRLIAEADVSDNSATPSRVAVISYRFWQEHYGGRNDAVGRRVWVAGQSFDVVGVTPLGFRGLSLTVEPDVMVPLTVYPLVTEQSMDLLKDGSALWIRVTGRLRPSVTAEQARAALESAWPTLRASSVPVDYSAPQRQRFLRMKLTVASAATGVEPVLRNRFWVPLRMLLAISGLTLAIASINLTGMLLARTTARAGDVVLRVALGGSRWQAVRPLVAESALLVLLGAAGGLWLAILASRYASSAILADYAVRTAFDPALHLRVLAFGGLLAVAVSLVCSMGPTLAVARIARTRRLLQSSRTSSRRTSFGRWLVVAQIGLSVVLLSLAGLLTRSLMKVLAVNPGMQTEGVLLAFPTPSPGGYSRVDNDTYFPALIERMGALPGVRSAAITLFKPAGGRGDPESVRLTGAQPSSGADALFMANSPGLFATLGIPMRTGRDFSWEDTSHGRRVAIVSETLSTHLSLRAPVLGTHIMVGVDPAHLDLEVIGVVADSHLYDLRDSNTSAVYVPALQESDNSWKCIVVRASGLSVRQINDAVGAFGYEQVTSEQSLAEAVDRTLFAERMNVLIAGYFGVFVLVLSAVGVYGLLTYHVVQHRRDIGVRVALGATRRQVVGDVIVSGMRLAAAGIFGGVIVAVLSGQLVSSLLVGVSPRDPLTFVAAPAVMALAVAAACLPPAWSAARTDAVLTLRAE